VENRKIDRRQHSGGERGSEGGINVHDQDTDSVERRKIRDLDSKEGKGRVVKDCHTEGLYHPSKNPKKRKRASGKRI